MKSSEVGWSKSEVEIWNFMQIGFNFVGELKTATVGNLPTERAAEEEVMWGWLKYNKFQRYQK